MKKLLVSLIALMLVLGTPFAVSAEETASPVKSYDSAAAGDLLYTVDFNGDSAFQPAVLGTNQQMTATASDDGRSVTVKNGTKSKKCYWGGKIADLTVDGTTYYTMTYKVKATEESGNSITVGGVWLSDPGVTDGLDGGPVIYGNYSAHNSVAQESQASALWTGKSRIASDVMWSSLDKEVAVDSDGYITMALSFDGPAGKFMGYYVAEDGTAQLIETQNYSGSAMCLVIYGYNKQVDTTVMDAKIYKGTISDVIKTTAPETTAPKPNVNTEGMQDYTNEENDTADIRFVASFKGDYRTCSGAGFEFTYSSQTENVDCNYVYETLNSKTGSISAADFEADYFFCYTLKNISAGEYTIAIRSWLLEDGSAEKTYSEAKTVTFTVGSDGIVTFN